MILLHSIKIFEDTKGVFRSRKSKKDRQYNGQKKRTNNDLQNITQKTEDGATRIMGELICYGMVSSFFSSSDTVKQHKQHVIGKLCWTPWVI